MSIDKYLPADRMCDKYSPVETTSIEELAISQSERFSIEENTILTKMSCRKELSDKAEKGECKHPGSIEEEEKLQYCVSTSGKASIYLPIEITNMEEQACQVELSDKAGEEICKYVDIKEWEEKKLQYCESVTGRTDKNLHIEMMSIEQRELPQSELSCQEERSDKAEEGKYKYRGSSKEEDEEIVKYLDAAVSEESCANISWDDSTHSNQFRTNITIETDISMDLEPDGNQSCGGAMCLWQTASDLFKPNKIARPKERSRLTRASSLGEEWSEMIAGNESMEDWVSLTIWKSTSDLYSHTENTLPLRDKDEIGMTCVSKTRHYDEKNEDGLKVISSKESLGEKTAKTVPCSESIEDAMISQSSTETYFEKAGSIKSRRQLDNCDASFINEVADLVEIDSMSLLLSNSDEKSDSLSIESMRTSTVISAQSRDIDVILQAISLD
mmetsp:Transcript_34148/g.40864  ORF Transcript_34148/g.40864 Transcript_34148/m.40864 type:complete len:443 (+) Transcript_34148:42-1370(+)